MFYPIKVNLSSGTKEKLRKAMMDMVPITIQLNASDLDGNDELLLTARQVAKIKRHRLVKKGLRLQMSKAVLQANKKHGNGLGDILKEFGPAIGSILGGLFKGGDDGEKKKKKGGTKVIVVPQSQPVIMNTQPQPQYIPPPQYQQPPPQYNNQQQYYGNGLYL